MGSARLEHFVPFTKGVVPTVGFCMTKGGKHMQYTEREGGSHGNHNINSTHHIQTNKHCDMVLEGDEWDSNPRPTGSQPVVLTN